MSISKSGATLLIALSLSGAAAADESSPPRLGEPISDAEADEIDYVVLPNGDGLPSGGGDARLGEALYAQHCIACHGAGGEDGINDRLAGGQDTINTDQPVRTVGSYWPYATTIFDYIRRAMPYQDPGSLNDDEVYSLTAYLLYLNGIIDADTRIDADTLPGIEMPNRDNFVWAYTPRLRAD